VLKLVVFETGGTTSLTLWQTDQLIRTNHATSAYPIFITQDAGFARENLLSRGVLGEELITDHTVAYFCFYDPDGNVLEACQVHE
jgi:hypothetical protein